MKRTGVSCAALAMAVAFASAGCSGSPGSGVDLTLHFDDSVADAALAQVNTLSISVTGDETGVYAIPFGRAAARDERIVYRPKPTSHTISLVVRAEAVDAATNLARTIALGSQSMIDLSPDRATAVSLALSAPASPDAGMDDLALPILDGSAPVDAGVDQAMVAPSLCPGSGFELCESFENGVSSAWTPYMTNGTLAIDGTLAYRGEHSLRLHGDSVAAGNTVDIRLAESETFQPSSPADVFVRGFFFVPADPANAAQVFSIVESASPYDGVSALVTPTGYLASGDSVSGGSYLASTSVSVPTGRWFCLEWQVHVSSSVSMGYLHTWLDGNEVADLEKTEPTAPAAGLAVVSVGFEIYDPAKASPAFNVWADEVAVNGTRIGCGD